MTRRLALLGSAFQALRQHPLRTLLSTLGLVIGVAALVAILALIDGIEHYARDQIKTTTNLQSILVQPVTSDRVDGLRLRRESFPVPTLDDAQSFADRVGERATPILLQTRSVEMDTEGERAAAFLFAAGPGVWTLAPGEIAAGRTLTPAELRTDTALVVLSSVLAERLAPDAPASAVGRRVVLGGTETEVIGVLEDTGNTTPSAVGPYAAFAADTRSNPPTLHVHVAQAEHIGAVTDAVRAWLDERFDGGQAAFTVATDENRAEQLRRSMLLFKVVMGLITGISIVVGGVGVMNVLLITVTERTREIGVRKAAGARRGDIVLQFLAEAIAVSGVGSALGLVVGALGILAVTPVIRHLADAPFLPAFTVGTLVVVFVVALLVGIAFGTYPALRAARLRPADAIRHE